MNTPVRHGRHRATSVGGAAAVFPRTTSSRAPASRDVNRPEFRETQPTEAPTNLGRFMITQTTESPGNSGGSLRRSGRRLRGRNHANASDISPILASMRSPLCISTNSSISSSIFSALAVFTETLRPHGCSLGHLSIVSPCATRQIVGLPIMLALKLKRRLPLAQSTSRLTRVASCRSLREIMVEGQSEGARLALPGEQRFRGCRVVHQRHYSRARAEGQHPDGTRFFVRR